MKEKVLVYLGAIAAVVLLFWGARWYADNAHAQMEKTRQASAAEAAVAEQRLTQVKICKVFYQPLTDKLVLPGTVAPYEEIDLASKMPGTIEWIGPREGDRVKKGEKVLQLDVESAQARLLQARAAREQTDLKFKRVNELYGQGVATKDQLDDARTTLQAADAAVTAAEVAVNDGTLFSPIDGILDRRPVDPGEHIREGDVVMKIVDIDRVKILLNVPEKDILTIHTGQDVTVQFSNGAAHTFKGRVEYAAVMADAATRTYPVKAVVDNKEGLLRPGMIVRAMAPRRQLDKAIALPFFTILDREKGKSVFVVEDGIAHERAIATGIVQGGQVEIVSGLKEGDSLVVVGHRNLVDGQKVAISADVTDMAKAFLANGGDPSTFALDLLK